MKRAIRAAMVLGAPLLGGCQCGSDPEPSHVDPPDQETTTPQNHAPVIGDVEIPAFPPIGPHALLSVDVSDDSGLDHVEIEFENDHQYPAGGQRQKTVDFTGADLGEGFGRAVIRATDTSGWWTDHALEGIAVDLSPPDAQLLDGVVRRADGSDVWIWVGDAFVLGKVTVSFEGGEESYAFEQGYPDTFGDAWDESLVNFPSTSFPEGTGAFHIKVEDAVGNTTEKDFNLFLDGTAPLVDIGSPAPGDAVTGIFQVHASAGDDSGGSVWIALSLGGTPIGTFPGPDADVDIDTAAFAPGEVTLSAVALDEAGNESDPFEVPIVIQ